MTTNQRKIAFQTLEELQQLAPSVSWHVTYNYYTKLPAFQAIKDGSVEYSMYKRGWKGPSVDLEATVTNGELSKNGGVIVSTGLPKPTITEQIDRVNFKRYVSFVKANLGILESIGA